MPATHGRYLMPPARRISGLECSGTVAKTGDFGCWRWQVGDQVCALMIGEV
jgi:threonine dehydrogenase-like Zn-dependent dehydrogenase